MLKWRKLNENKQTKSKQWNKTKRKKIKGLLNKCRTCPHQCYHRHHLRLMNHVINRHAFHPAEPLRFDAPWTNSYPFYRNQCVAFDLLFSHISNVQSIQSVRICLLGFVCLFGFYFISILLLLLFDCFGWLVSVMLCYVMVWIVTVSE